MKNLQISHAKYSTFKILKIEIKQKNSPVFLLGNLNLALPTFPGRYQPSIISALDFTSVFEMGTGVTPKLYAPESFQNFYSCNQLKIVNYFKLMFVVYTNPIDNEAL